MEPKEKRARLSHDVDHDDKIPEHPLAVLADEYTNPLDFGNKEMQEETPKKSNSNAYIFFHNTVQAVTCPILQKRETSRLVKELGTSLPLTGLQHLRRVKPGKDKDSPLQILISSLSAINTGDDVTDITTDLVFSFLTKNGISPAGLGDPTIVSVCSRQPTTRQQFIAARLHWPSSFHENKDVTRKLNKEQFSESHLRKHGRYMQRAIEQSRMGSSEGEVVGAVVVDPASGAVVAAGNDRRYVHPLQHATMVAVDLVARAQGGGAWDLPGDSLYSGKIDCREDGTGPYLCTGYDLYVTREPCSMCAMALVHSRIRTVFYGSPSPHGALGTVYKVHSEPGLNHHYDVYHSLLRDECDKLLLPTEQSSTSTPATSKAYICSAITNTMDTNTTLNGTCACTTKHITEKPSDSNMPSGQTTDEGNSYETRGLTSEEATSLNTAKDTADPKHSGITPTIKLEDCMITNDLDETTACNSIL